MVATKSAGSSPTGSLPCGGAATDGAAAEGLADGAGAEGEAAVEGLADGTTAGWAVEFEVAQPVPSAATTIRKRMAVRRVVNMRDLRPEASTLALNRDRSPGQGRFAPVCSVSIDA